MGPRAQPRVLDADLVPKSLLDRGHSLAFPTVAPKGPFGHRTIIRCSQKVPPRLGAEQFPGSWFKQQDSTQKVEKRGIVQRIATKKKKKEKHKSFAQVKAYKNNLITVLVFHMTSMAIYPGKSISRFCYNKSTSLYPQWSARDLPCSYFKLCC